MAIYPEWVIKRAGGRRRYNAQRQRDQAIRRHEVAALLATGLNQSAIAVQLQVNRSTICRDVVVIDSMWRRQRCQFCKRWYRDFLGAPSPQCGAVGKPKRKRRAIAIW